uniref:SH3 domain-containing protein n=1 Tax=Neobodo designis TaxID=312471 RepID=A0A7S1Q6U7_NEODS|mmetsp:Transcript_34737/g.107274  ORF Transcript_34737/g.107274 Transcript_34737/m.107274 type:complete len:228 (+) Transcript_34737:43-726(+)|eukprot:CAMPEP_0174856612 /NCGR_PEP_ID=MMETSP1114-20130205/36131_1 /TAXON_ID=312471 /ORGANISM="Neobodo designis, Strain CCAP 1951/1" /LENGTH=227 /DNA_ID=CAMNT_0016091417 /DNA_START=41 /DNA_END=724 /DNA_ORIENTATION=-
MQYYTVQYRFDAEDQGELSVLVGDVVRAAAGSRPEEGWLPVELASNPRRKGVVPHSYLKETADPRERTEAQSQREASPPGPGPSYTNAALAHGKDSLRGTAEDSRQPAATGGLKPSSKVNPAQLVEGFMRNEVFFKQLMKQREESMAKIESALNEAASDLAVCRDKNGQLTRKLKELDTAMNKERSKWRERVEEERLLLAQKAAGGPVATVTTTTTTVSASRNRFSE